MKFSGCRNGGIRMNNLYSKEVIKFSMTSISRAAVDLQIYENIFFFKRKMYAILLNK